ncbi:MAG: hypothetical protein C5B50_01610 [Verrucomicrobia bacterium]|nr:MAG: hypothetical protein C5B50_01610 [Verrucomicrobiota bacterium]
MLAILCANATVSSTAAIACLRPVKLYLPMKRLRPQRKDRSPNKVACTVSAAALMLGVSHAATVGMHFMQNYCGSANYSGYIVTLTAFGIAPSGWQNLTPMQTGYSTSSPCTLPNMAVYTLSQMVSTNTSSGGLNPLPSGTVSLTWTANTANFSGFAGYGGGLPGYSGYAGPPSYAYDGPPPPFRSGNLPFPNGEWQIYNTFLRDGKNFGPIDNNAHGAPCGDNSMPPYIVDITGLKSLFTNSPFVVQLIAASDSMQTLTNAFIIDVSGAITNSVTYPNTPPVTHDEGGTCSWLRGHGGGLSTVSGTLNTDHIQITSNRPDHGGTGVPPTGFDRAGTISGFIVTDKPVITMSPRSVLAAPGDSLTLNPYAIGVGPLSYQWRKNGAPISGATSSALPFASLNATNGGNYDLVVTNLYGSATSAVATVTIDKIALTLGTKFVVDSNPANPERDGLNSGAAWLASSSDGTVTRTGVMQFTAANTNGITVQGTTNFDSAQATYTFWMRSSAGGGGLNGAALFCRPGDVSANDLLIQQQTSGELAFNAPNGGNHYSSITGVSDNHWHFIALTYSQAANGGVALYVDGALDFTNANASAWSAPAGQALQFGYTTDPTYVAYNGMLNDVRIYNRQLTSAEVTSVHNTGALIDTSALQMRFAFATLPLPGAILTWQLPNTILQSATDVTGPYSDLNAVTSPYYIVPIVTHKFYRYRAPLQVLVSNPYLM